MIPSLPLLVPPAVEETYREWDWRVVWTLVPHTVTVRLTHPDGRLRYLKLAEASWYPSPSHEAPRMRWARRHLPVPLVVESGGTDGIEWLLTEALQGIDATDSRVSLAPPDLVPVLARGLGEFHRAPVEDCPFVFDLDTALAHAERRAAAGLIDPGRDFHPEHRHLTVRDALNLLVRHRPRSEDLVVCHGDYCFPNILVAGGRVAGFLDLGELGVADRWWDLAVATWSAEWNIGLGYEDLFLDAYGIEADPDRMRYYRLLYDVVS